MNVEKKTKINFNETGIKKMQQKSKTQRESSIIIRVTDNDKKTLIGWVNYFDPFGMEVIYKKKNKAIVFANERQAELYYPNGKIKTISGRGAIKDVTQKYTHEKTKMKPTLGFVDRKGTT